MLRSLARSLFENERLRTTESKAKLLRPYAERLITKAKHGTVHHRRQVLSAIEDRNVVHKLFSDIGPRFADRSGGYTRVLKLGTRNGDGAPMALIELVESGGVVTTAETTEEGTSGRRRRLRRPRRRAGAPEAAAAGAGSAEEPEDETFEAEDELEEPTQSVPEDEQPPQDDPEAEAAAQPPDTEEQQGT